MVVGTWSAPRCTLAVPGRGRPPPAGRPIRREAPRMLMTEEGMSTDRARGADRDGSGVDALPGVLLVDDDDAMREMLHDLFVRDGRFSVAAEARDSRDAVEAACRLQRAAL